MVSASLRRHGWPSSYVWNVKQNAIPEWQRAHGTGPKFVRRGPRRVVYLLRDIDPIAPNPIAPN